MTSAPQQPLSPLDACRVFKLVNFHETGRGSLTAIQSGEAFPIDIRRVFYIFDIPSLAVRGGHAHYKMNEVVVAVSGCFDVVITDGASQRTITLRRPDEALLLPAGVWRSLSGFSSGCVVLSICDTEYDEADYIRDFNHYLTLTKHNESPEIPLP